MAKHIVLVSNTKREASLFAVDIENNERKVRRYCYETVFGKPSCDEEKASDETVMNFTAVVSVSKMQHFLMRLSDIPNAIQLIK